MDIQLLLSASGPAAGAPAPQEAGQAPSGEFARHLAGASQARSGGDAGSLRAPTGQAGASLAPQEARHGSAEASAEAAHGDEALAALLPGPAGMSGEEAVEALAPLPPVDADIVTETGGETLAKAGPLGTRLPAEEVEAALQGLPQDEARPDDGEATVHPDIWRAFQERLALIEQAGRPQADEALAAVPLAAAAGAAGAHTPGMANPAGPAAGGTIRLNPLLEAIAAERRGAAAPSSTPATALSAATERLSAQGATPAAASDEAPRLAATGAALTAQRNTPSRAGAGLEGSDRAAHGVPGALSGATGGAAAGAMSGSAATPAPASLPAPVASPAWSQQLGQQLVRLSQQGGEQRVELKLHPAELGPLSVSLKMSDHGAQAQFVSAHAQVRQALEQAIPQLREALAEQGISLGETSVGEQRQGGSEGDGTPGRPAGRLASNGGNTAEEGVALAVEEGGIREHALDGRVDLYA